MTSDDLMSTVTLKPDSPVDHPGEWEMRERFPSRFHWDKYSLPSMMRPVITKPLGRLIEAQPFFFIATSDADGHCDCSFRGSERNASGEPLPAVQIIDPGHLIFPDFSGNGLYNSLGNILTNPHIGMLFIDFTRQVRARVNGIASILPADEQINQVWPTAQAAVLVAVEQAYANCKARIPRLVDVTNQAHEGVAFI